MSELEIQRRQEYKRNRKKWILVQLVAIILLTAIALGSFLIYNRMNMTYYIEYTESSNIDYKVQYMENDFFEQDLIGAGQTYISALIDGIVADFTYRLNMGAADMGFDYNYKIDAKLLIASKDTGNPYYTVEENLLPLKSNDVKKASSIRVKESVLIDYEKYNEIANTFVKTYALKDATATLIVTLDVEVLSTGEQLDQENQNRYFTSLNIPLAVDTFGMHTSSSSPANETKVLEYKDIADRDLFLVLSIIFAVLAGVVAIVLLVFIHITKNEDITYAARVRKILSTYGSYIQRTEGEFDSKGYQTVNIKTFTEMLGIRDTIQSPILMSENRDETMTRFFIPTNTDLLYVFEIKVDNYDEIYANIDFVVEKPVEEELVVLEKVDLDELSRAMAEPDVQLSEIEFEPDDDDRFAVSAEEPGVEVVGVVWREKEKQNKVYRYDPNGEKLDEGDIVLVPTHDAAKGQDVIRKVAVAHGNHRVAPEHIKHPLKKVIAVIKRKVASSLTPNANENIKK